MADRGQLNSFLFQDGYTKKKKMSMEGDQLKWIQTKK